MCTVKWSSVGKVAQVHSSTETESSPLHQSSPASRICLIWPIIGWKPRVHHLYNIPMKKKKVVSYGLGSNFLSNESMTLAQDGIEWVLFSNLLLAWGMTRGALWLSLITIRQPRHRSSGTPLKQVGPKRVSSGIKVLSWRINIELCVNYCRQKYGRFFTNIKIFFLLHHKHLCWRQIYEVDISVPLLEYILLYTYIMYVKTLASAGSCGS